jgi:hypothetical protein
MNSVEYLEGVLLKLQSLALNTPFIHDEEILRNLDILRTAECIIDGKRKISFAVFRSIFNVLDKLLKFILFIKAKSLLISFISKPFYKRVQYVAASLLCQFTANNTLDSSDLRRICLILQKPLLVELRTLAELLICLRNTYERSTLVFHDSKVITEEIMTSLNNVILNIHPSMDSKVVNLIICIVDLIVKKHLTLFNSGSLLYDILIKLLSLQDHSIVIQSLQLLITIFRSFKNNVPITDFYIFVIDKGILNHLYRLLLQYENDLQSRKIVLKSLVNISYVSINTIKAIMEYGFLPLLQFHLLNDKEDDRMELGEIFLNILSHTEFHETLIEFGIVQEIINISLDRSTTVSMKSFNKAFCMFCKKIYISFVLDRDPLYFQQRVHILLYGIKNHNHTFFENTILFMIKQKAF